MRISRKSKKFSNPYGDYGWFASRGKKGEICGFQPLIGALIDMVDSHRRLIDRTRSPNKGSYIIGKRNPEKSLR